MALWDKDAEAPSCEAFKRMVDAGGDMAVAWDRDHDPRLLGDVPPRLYRSPIASYIHVGPDGGFWYEYEQPPDDVIHSIGRWVLHTWDDLKKAIEIHYTD